MKYALAVGVGMRGELEGSSVFMRDVREASQTYSKGCFGYPLSGGFLELDLIEAAFLLAHERLDVFSKGRKITFPELFQFASSVVEGFDIKYLVYRDLREGRGFIVKPGSGAFDFRVYARGVHPSEAPPAFLVVAASECTATDFSAFSGDVAGAEDMGKKLLYAVADQEADITYYRMDVIDPRGRYVVRQSAVSAEAYLVGDRAFVYDGSQAAELRQEAFYGKEWGGVLQLSLIECCYLVSVGELRVYDNTGKMMTVEALKSLGRNTQDGFGYRLKAFSDLRNRGLLVKAGFKYGTHFRLYEKSPDECHARYLVHAVPASTVAVWPEISRIVRLSGGVRKDILFCRVGESNEYLSFKWFKP